MPNNYTCKLALNIQSNLWFSYTPCLTLRQQLPPVKSLMPRPHYPRLSWDLPWPALGLANCGGGLPFLALNTAMACCSTVHGSCHGLPWQSCRGLPWQMPWAATACHSPLQAMTLRLAAMACHGTAMPCHLNANDSTVHPLHEPYKESSIWAMRVIAHRVV